MAETPKRAGPSLITAAATAQTVYSAPAVNNAWAVVRDVMIANVTAAAITVSIGIDQAGTDATSERFIANVVVQPGEPWAWGGVLTLLGGAAPDRLYVVCDTANAAVVTVSAIEGPDVASGIALTDLDARYNRLLGRTVLGGDGVTPNATTTATTAEDFPGATLTITASGRPVAIEWGIGQVSHSLAAGKVELLLYEGTTYIDAVSATSPAANSNVGMQRKVTLTPSPGAHTYKLMRRINPAGTGTFFTTFYQLFLDATELPL